MTPLSHVATDTLFAASPTDSHWPPACIGADIEVVSRKRMASFTDCLFRVCYTSSVGSIAHVLFLSAYREMIRIKARWIVAIMKHANLRIERQTCEGERNHAMNANDLAFKVQAAVSIGVFCASPVPAGGIHA